jgi:hypothetical protein
MPPSTKNPAPRTAGRVSERNFAAANFQSEGNLLPPDLQERLPLRRRDGNAEARLQSTVVSWVRTVAPQTLIFAVPNGGLRTKAEAARLKWTGTVAGVPDLVIVASGGRVFFLECKTRRGSLSPDQRSIFHRLVSLAAPRAIIRSMDDVRRAFAEWGIATLEAPNA